MFVRGFGSKGAGAGSGKFCDGVGERMGIAGATVKVGAEFSTSDSSGPTGAGAAEIKVSGGNNSKNFFRADKRRFTVAEDSTVAKRCWW